MKPILTVLAIALFFAASGQTRYYFFVGTNFNTGIDLDGFYLAGVGNQVWSTDGSYISHRIGQYINADFLIEKRINKTIYGVTGLMFSQAGYENHLLNNYSQFKCSYAGLPLMIRINILNGFLLDVGPVVRVPIVADLKETALRGTPYELSDHRDVASYLQRVSTGWAWQNTILVNRYTFTFYVMGGKSLIDERIFDDWKINQGLRNNSLFLRNIYPKFVYTMLGLKLGVRL